MEGSATSAFAISVTLSLIMAAVLIVLVSMWVAFSLRWRELTQYYKHPLTEHRPFKSLPFSMQAGVYLDIFLHMQLPKVKSGMIGNANAMLKHINPRDVPFRMRWPIAGFWGGLMAGLAAQLVFFGVVIFNSL